MHRWILGLALAAGGPVVALRTIKVGDCTESVNKDQQVEGPLDCHYPDGKPKYLTHEIHGKRDGEARSWSQDGKLTAIENYRDDQLDGLSIKYDDKGQVTEETRFKAGKKDGVCKEYRNGKIERVQLYADGDERGPFTEYFPNGNVKQRGSRGPHGLTGLNEWLREDGKLESSQLLDDGKMAGPKREYWPNGQLKSEELWRHVAAGPGTRDRDEQHGLKKTFHDNDTPDSTSCYQNGKLTEGLSACLGTGGAKEVVKSLFADGKPSEIATYDHGKKNGSYQSFYPGGTPRETSNYLDDQLDGVFKRFFESGKPKVTITFKAGKKNGPEERFHDNGRLEERVTWKDGAQVARSELYENGKPHVEETAEGKLWKRNIYYDTGTLESEDTVSPRVWSFYDWDDDEYLGAYHYEVREGLAKEYNADGKLEYEASYKDGERDGTAKSYFASGRLESEERFREGDLLSRKDYDETGKLLLTEEYNEDGSRK